LTREILDSSRILPAIENEIGGSSESRRTVDEVVRAIDEHYIVIVGMDQNPFPKKARKLLDAQGIVYHYMGYGSYFSEWKRRGALKMWSGWQTFPMVFVQGKLIGGFTDLEQLVKNGELKK
jgi:glutaredoxin-related protein